MFFEKVFFYFSLLHLTNLHLQINLHLTDWVSEDNNLQYNCLQVSAYTVTESDPRQIISYCMNEFSSKSQIKENHRDQKFTFEQLANQKITNEQLYHWSAPIDLIEEYQFYLNQLSKSEKTSLSTRIFYNCTLPYFGPQCQYLLQDQKPSYSSLDEIIHSYYYYNRYQPTLLTCYMHLKCNRGPFPACLDWTEICDGKVDCLDGGSDEEHCWQLELHQPDEDDYPRSNRQCISEAYFRHDPYLYQCDGKLTAYQRSYVISDESDISIPEPTFNDEDISCAKYNNVKEDVHVLTSSCIQERTYLLSQAMFSIKPNSMSNECWTALKCLIPLSAYAGSIYPILCERAVVNDIINNTCPDMIYIPAVPVLLGHIYIVYNKSISMNIYSPYLPAPTYFCYNDQFLRIPDGSRKKLLPDNNTCHFYDIRTPPELIRDFRWIHRYIGPLYHWLQKQTISIDENFEMLNKSMMYKCMNWPKYISNNRLLDSVLDCQPAYDETILNKTCSNEQNMNYFKCVTTNECIPMHLVQDNFCDCTIYDGRLCDDEHIDVSYSRNTISFQTICDGYTHLTPSKVLEDQNETDETNCELWPRVHIYNRCDGFWHTLDGSDEIDCPLSSLLLNCSTNQHVCVSPETNELMCLPIERANDGIIDCLGAADEPTLCQNMLYRDDSEIFYCPGKDQNDCVGSESLCDNEQNCYGREDEQACRNSDLSAFSHMKGVCTEKYESNLSDVVKILCRRFSYPFFKLRGYFTLDQSQNLIQRNIRKESISFPYQFTKENIQSYQQRCHRGLDLQVWFDQEKNLTTNVCLCPPSSYGDICQYQNQRVSLTLQFNVTSDSVQTPFIIIVSLIDHTDERLIHSYEQFTYLPMKNCRRKFNIYLLYSTRLKNETKDYSIHIDIYEKATLNYRGSTMKSLKFPFLPVHRLAFQVNIPRILDDIDHCSDEFCVNGKCRKYFNDRNNRTFCQCEKGWSGDFCTIPYISLCSSDSLSLGKLSNNRSICICPVNKMGPRCLINDVTCRNAECLNKGKCISVDEYGSITKKFICICPKEFTGDQCEIARTKLMMRFDKKIRLPSTMFVHFIEMKIDALPVRTTTFKTISFGQDSVIVYWSLPFHIAFVELSNETYYLVHLQTIYNQSAIIEKTVDSSDQCLNLTQIFNETMINSSLRRRIKYYHLPCQTNSSELKCFYDEIHFCLCQQIHQQRVANCFEFNRQMNLNCSGGNGCKNGGQCFQEQTTCPRVSVCQCPICYYGAQCQLNTNDYTLSLDAILAYHIRPNLNISHQSSAVLTSLVLTLIITLFGFANGILSFLTFKQKSTHESGCGLYLLSSSVITLLTMIIFLLKFVILLLAQMGSITNRSFLIIQCYSMDFLLRFGLTMDQWLTTFVAIERALIITKGIRFSKQKSISTAKWTIVALVLITIVTNIHDPIYRSLFVEDNNDDDEKRVLCMVEYPSTIRILNSIIHICHLVIPFIINLISALTIIIMSTRYQATIKRQQEQNDILHEQIKQHKNLLIGPCVLIILAIPRLIFSFTSGCMKSTSDAWLFLMGYFISLIPPLLTFILFVLPSIIYKQAFRKATSHYRHIIRQES